MVRDPTTHINLGLGDTASAGVHPGADHSRPGSNEQGTAILLVEQNALMALDVAQRGCVLQTGQVVLSGDAAKLRSDDEVRKRYLGED